MPGTNKAVYAKSSRAALDRLNALIEGKQFPAPSKGRCVFISHKKEDTAACEPIAKYLMDSGVDIYFDLYDKTLDQLVREGNPQKVTQRLQDGIDYSSHMLCVVSKATVGSYWVPFEVGYGYRHTDLGVLTLKGVTDQDLPDYMKVPRVIRGTNSLNNFIAELLGNNQAILESRGVIKKNSTPSHPLDGVLDWQA